MGYHDTGAYKLYDSIKKKMMLNRDVIVLENEHWNWNHMQSSWKKTLVHGLTDDFALGGAETINDSNLDLNETSQRPRRKTVRPPRFSNYEIYPNAGINEEGDLFHIFVDNNKT